MDDAGLLSHYFPNFDMSYNCILNTKAKHIVTNMHVVQAVFHLVTKLARTRSMTVDGGVGAETMHEHGVGNTAAEHAATHKLGGQLAEHWIHLEQAEREAEVRENSHAITVRRLNILNEYTKLAVLAFTAGSTTAMTPYES